MLIHCREHIRKIGSTQKTKNKNILQKDEWKTHEG
jgi:hypothetical protein